MSRTISGNYTNPITLTNGDSPVTVTGTIVANVRSGVALTAPGSSAWSITNAGTISNTNAFQSSSLQVGADNNYAPQADVTNLSGGLIYGAGGGITLFSDAPSVTNNAGGTISSGYFTAVGLYGGPGTVVNAGVILAQHSARNSYGAYTQGNGVSLYDGGLVVNQAGGTISGTRGGVDLSGGYYKTPGGNTNPGDAVYGCTLDNFGTIIGGGLGGSVHFYTYSRANRLIDNPGAVFIGGTYGTVPGQGTYQNVTGDGGTLELASGSSAGVLDGFGTDFTGFRTLQFDPGAKWTVSGSATALSDNLRITGFNSNDTIDLTGFTETKFSFENNELVLTNSSGGTVTLDIHESAGSSFNVSSSDGTVIINGPVTCFVDGTHILTDQGEVPVETLEAGATVITADGQTRRVRWIGRRRLDLRRHAAPDLAQPIRIRAGAFADGVPHRDLRLSPDHAVLLDDVLVPARLLINGASIQRETRHQTVTYYHVELETHDILLAEALPVESYLDTGNRGTFDSADAPLILHPDFADAQRRRVAGSCRPFVDEAADVEPLWHRLSLRAATLGFGPLGEVETTMDPDLHIVTGGRAIRPTSAKAGCYTFLLPRADGPMRLVSRATRPCELRPWVEDRRRLGIRVSRLTLRIGNEVQAVPLDHPLLAQGWWDIERNDATLWRWTNGNAVLPLSGGPAVLEVEVADPLDYPTCPEILPASPAQAREASA